MANLCKRWKNRKKNFIVFWFIFNAQEIHTQDGQLNVGMDMKNGTKKKQENENEI